ncbi:MAG: DUF2723 domain-containing protein, partial [Verrucomicrobiae bacterium]|nr:DUF2723 domain-containing protein [Verrucomicrobiae bacterium]
MDAFTSAQPQPLPADELIELPPERTGPFFARTHWLAFWIVTLLVGFVYISTASPSVTLEDSGEFITAAAHLGVPHPPGYPTWTMINYAFIHILPFGNVAWRVNVCSGVFGAIACGLVALLTAFLTEQICTSPRLAKHYPAVMPKNGVVLVSGVVAGLCLGFVESLWFQCVIAEVYALNAFFLAMVLLSMLRWFYEPERKRWGFLTFFFFGVGLTNHQTLLIMSPAVLVLMGLMNWRILRDFMPYVLMPATMMALGSRNHLIWFMTALFYGIFLIGMVWSFRKTKSIRMILFYFLPLLLLPLAAGYFAAECVNDTLGGPSYLPNLLDKKFAIPLCALALLGQVSLSFIAPKSVGEGRTVLLIILGGILGLSFVVYMPLASKTNPPMNWSYTSTMNGFLHSITRGQYDSLKEARSAQDFFLQIQYYYSNLLDNFSLPVAFLGVLALLGIFDAEDREKKYMLVLMMAWFCLSLLLTYVLNTSFDEQSLFVFRVFYSASHLIFAIWIGLGVAMTYVLVNHIRTITSWYLALALLTSLAFLAIGFNSPYLIYLVLGMGAFALLIFLWHTFRRPEFVSWRYAALGVMALIPVIPFHASWYPSWRRDWTCNARDEEFGWMYGYDMLKNVDRNAVIFGGTDPGRFVPTFMIFVESFAGPKGRYFKGRDFDRRDLYIITQNALADQTYMSYIRDHYSESRPTQYNAFEKQLGRDKQYPSKPLKIPDEARFADIFAEVTAELANVPGSGISDVEDGKGQMRRTVTGVNGVFAINGAICKDIFENNKKNHAFYLEESFPIGWMYPYLEPAGLIMKFNPEPIAKIPDEAVKRDRAYWTAYVARLFAHPSFAEDIVARRTFAKLRSSIGGLYLWRGMYKEAEIALLQSMALQEGSSETGSRLVELYVRQGRYDRAMNVVNRWIEADPRSTTAREVAGNVQAIAEMAADRARVTAQYLAKPGDGETFVRLARILAQLAAYDELDAHLLRFVSQPNYDNSSLQRVVQIYLNFAQADRVKANLSKAAQQHPRDYALWYDLAVARAGAPEEPSQLNNGISRLSSTPDLRG